MSDLSDTEEDLVVYGTPLEPLEEDEIPNKKPRLIEDQVVTDKQGRRRFHGAFTGGFSAGFFNTVGSLEGWVPSSFKSSKSKKQEIIQQMPQDFMDEEDMSEFGIAPVVLQARQDYRTEVKKNVNIFPEVHKLGTYVLQDVLKHVRETIGIKLLKKMGWKPGQGVGPRLNKNEKKKSIKMIQKTYGCQLPPGSLNEDEEEFNSDSEWDNVEYAPSDYESFLCEAKNNFFGLGYEGLDKTLVLSGNLALTREEIISQKKGRKFGSQAFGVGAFEEEDEDIYERDDMSRYNFFIGKDESSDVKQLRDKNSIVPEGVLDGFCMEGNSFVRKNYPLPILPKDYIPHRKIRRSRFDQSPPSNSENDFEDFRIKSLVQKSRREIGYCKKEEENLTKKLISNIKIDENRFKPFLFNPEKQERYENYLKLIKIGKRELLSDLQPLAMTNWEKEREKLEFEKAASLFRPFTGGMEERFETASQPDDLSDPLASVEKYVDESDDRKKAARLKMHGALTRKTENWIPNSLLCKRFNIPELQKSNIQSSGNHKRKSYRNLFETIQNLQVNVEKFDKLKNSFIEKSNEFEADVAQSKEESIIDTKDKTDLFKVIFLDSDDEECLDKAIEKPTVHEGVHLNKTSEKIENTEDVTLYEEKLINSKRNSSPAKGLFRSLDLESLSEKKHISTFASKEPAKNENVLPKATEGQGDSALNLIYGPKIPEKITVKTDFITSAVSIPEGIWIEKKNRTRKKHKKKDKKSKSSHKSKHKSKHKR